MTNIEKAMKQALDEAGLRYEQEYPLRSGFVADFAFPDKGIIVECDGERWHGSNEAKKRDRFRDYILRRGGWVVLRFSGSSILEDIDSCLLVIKRRLNGGNQ